MNFFRRRSPNGHLGVLHKSQRSNSAGSFLQIPSNNAAARGDIPTVKVGRLLRVPVRAMERKLDTAGERDETAA